MMNDVALYVSYVNDLAKISIIFLNWHLSLDNQDISQMCLRDKKII